MRMRDAGEFLDGAPQAAGDFAEGVEFCDDWHDEHGHRTLAMIFKPYWVTYGIRGISFTLLRG